STRPSPTTAAQGRTMSRASSLSVRTIALLGSFVVAVVPAIVLGITSANTLRTSVVHEELAQSLQRARSLADDVYVFMQLRKALATMIADQVAAMDTLDSAAITDFLQRTRRNF